MGEDRWPDLTTVIQREETKKSIENAFSLLLLLYSHLCLLKELMLSHVLSHPWLSHWVTLLQYVTDTYLKGKV